MKNRCNDGLHWFAKTMKQRYHDVTMNEISGSLGDLGTFLPLLLNLAAFQVVLFSPALFFAGLYNILTGIVWNSPMPVQPMKTIAAVALASGDKLDPGLTPEEVVGAGLSVGTIVFLLGITGLVEMVNWFIPIQVVRGLQLGLGCSMVHSGIKLNYDLSFASEVDCILLTILSILFVLTTTRMSWDRIPSALILSLVGFIIALVETANHNELVLVPAFPPTLQITKGLTWGDVWSGFLKAGLAQLPLTTLNSVVSVCDLNNNNLFKGEPEKHITRKSVASSVGLMNLSGLWFGAMPMCHGAGGLAAQHRFGARTGAALLFLGVIKVLIAIILGHNGNTILQYFPTSILGAMLIFAGLGLGIAGLSQVNTNPDLDETRRNNNMFIVLATAAVTITLKTGWGFLAGMVAAVFAGGFDHVWARLQDWRSRSRNNDNNQASGNEILPT